MTSADPMLPPGSPVTPAIPAFPWLLVASPVPPGWEGQVRPRSGLALRHGITLPNAPGTIDSDYRGELQVILANSGREPVTIRRGDRIAQLVVAPVAAVEWIEADELSASGREGGGFGSTGRE